jgi:hypothetical protein
MKVIIAGSRGLDTLDESMRLLLVRNAVQASGFAVTDVMSGTARGADQAGEKWAETLGISIRRFPANWARNGRAAGWMRNQEMGEYADALIAIWDGKSKGTKNMIEIMQRLKKPTFVKYVDLPISIKPPRKFGQGLRDLEHYRAKLFKTRG